MASPTSWRSRRKFDTKLGRSAQDFDTTLHKAEAPEDNALQKHRSRQTTQCFEIFGMAYPVSTDHFDDCTTHHSQQENRSIQQQTDTPSGTTRTDDQTTDQGHIENTRQAHQGVQTNTFTHTRLCIKEIPRLTQGREGTNHSAGLCSPPPVNDPHAEWQSPTHRFSAVTSIMIRGK